MDGGYEVVVEDRLGKSPVCDECSAKMRFLMDNHVSEIWQCSLCGKLLLRSKIRIEPVSIFYPERR